MKSVYNRPFTDCITLQSRYSMCSEATNPKSGPALTGDPNDRGMPGRKLPIGL